MASEEPRGEPRKKGIVEWVKDHAAWVGGGIVGLIAIYYLVFGQQKTAATPTTVSFPPQGGGSTGAAVPPPAASTTPAVQLGPLPYTGTNIDWTSFSSLWVSAINLGNGTQTTYTGLLQSLYGVPPAIGDYIYQISHNYKNATGLIPTNDQLTAWYQQAITAWNAQGQTGAIPVPTTYAPSVPNVLPLATTGVNKLAVSSALMTTPPTSKSAM